MAAAIVSNFSNELLRALESAEAAKIMDVMDKRDVMRVKGIVRGVIGAAPGAEKKQSSSLTVHGWFEKLGDLILDADDLLEEIRYHKNAIDWATKVRLIISCNPGHNYILRRFTEICKDLHVISKQRPKIGFGVDRNVVRKTGSQAPEGVVGRDAEKQDIITLLEVPPAQPATATLNISASSHALANMVNIHSSSSSQPSTNMSNISTIAIVGLPGSGKTTLAQLVCSDASVKGHFYPVIWAYVSDLSTCLEILTKILESATLQSNANVRLPHDQLLDEIHGKKYLLVLDDMSINDKREWDSLKALLNKGAPGSKILITTRYQNVGGMAIAASVKIYKLGALSDADAWLLFKRFALPESQEQEQIENNIVRKCENLPLILKLAANLVAHKSNWQQLRDENLDIMDIFNHHKSRHLLNVLRPSYDQLSPYLKHCVAYCSLFPRDYEFSKQALMQLWMAQGFLEPDDNSSSLEDIGERQFQTLVKMSFFQAVKLDGLGHIITCRMHKMFHHLAQNEAGAGCIMASDSTKFDNRTLHVSVKFNNSFPDSLMTARKLRTLLCHKDSKCRVKLSRSICQMMISKFKCLRTLSLSDCGLDVLPDNAGDLIHLRFLDLSKNHLVTLPESITKLGNLQMLNLNMCQRLKSLPQSMGRLAMLRCLEIEECDRLTYMPLELEKLTSLQSLSRFVVCSPSEANKGSGGIRVLKNLNNLRGRLKIELSGQWTELVQDAPSACLKNKRNLTDLKVEWKLKAVDDARTCHYYEAFLEGLHPPNDLKVLCIEGYKGRDFPSWAKIGTLPRCLDNIVIVSIEGCKECKHIPPFGQLKFLEYLTLRSMESVQYMVDDKYDPEFSPLQISMFKSLKELTLHNFYSLKGWWKEVRVTEKDGLPSFPQLSKLKIWNCPKLTSMPLFNNVEEVDFLDVNQRLFEIFSVKVESPLSPFNVSNVHETLADFSYDQSSEALSYGLLEKLKKLKTLHIKSCPKMQRFPKVWNESIENLVIDNCDELTSVAPGLHHLNSLERLEISYCNKLNFWEGVNRFPWGSLKKLQVLIFRGFTEMKALPTGCEMIDAFKTVEVFHITRCSALTALPEWIGKMSSLKKLRLEACPNLTSLPEGTNCLHQLDKLEIMECPQLMERCREGGGDRSKINCQAQVLLHKSWRYGLTNTAERTSEGMHSQFAVNDTTLLLAKTGKGNLWEEVTFKSKIKVVN